MYVLIIGTDHSPSIHAFVAARDWEIKIHCLRRDSPVNLTLERVIDCQNYADLLLRTLEIGHKKDHVHGIWYHLNQAQIADIMEINNDNYQEQIKRIAFTALALEKQAHPERYAIPDPPARTKAKPTIEELEEQRRALLGEIEG